MIRAKLLAVAAVVAAGALLAAPAPARAATSWDVAVLIYRAVDVDCQGRRITSSLANVAHDPADVARRFGSTATSWSDGGAAVTVTVIEAGTLRSASPNGTGCWPAPADVAIPSGFDSIVVMYEADAEDVPGMNPWGGLAFEGLVAGSYTYATIPIPDGDEWWFWSNPTPELGAVHEWLHGAGGYYRSSFPSIPGLHSSRDYGYTDEVAWHSDFMGGDIAGGLGLTAEVWASGSPNGEAPAPAKPCRKLGSNAKACRP